MHVRSTAPRLRRGSRSRSRPAALALLAVGLALALFGPGGAAAAHQGVNLDQCSNGQFGSPQSCPPGWQNGDLNPQNSFYREGDSVPFRATLSGLSAGSHTLVIQYDTTKSGKHAYDYLTTYSRTVAGVDPCDGVTCSGSPSTYPIPLSGNPTPPNVGLVPQSDRQMTLWNGTITGIALGGAADVSGQDQSITISFTTSSDTVVLAWAGHVADEITWPIGSAAGSIPGSPYHMRTVSLDGDSSGNQDRSMKTDVIAPAITTDVGPAPEISFAFLGGPVVDHATLAGDGQHALSGNVSFYSCFAASGTPDCTTGGTLVSTNAVSQASVSDPGTATSDSYDPQDAGTYCFRAVYTPDANAYYSPASETNALLQNDGNHGECFIVGQSELQGSSTETHIHSGDAVDPDSLVIGSTLHDVAIVKPEVSGTPTGTVTFSLFNGTTCSGDAVSSEQVPLVDGSASSSDATLPDGGLSYLVTYNGDGTYATSNGLCERVSSETPTPPPPVTPPATPPAPPATPPAPPAAPVSSIDLAIVKAASSSSVALGGRVTWTLVVRNNGPDAATGVKVADPLPAGISFVSVGTSQGTCTGGQVVSCDLGGLGVGPLVVIQVVTTATATGNPTNTATVVGNEPEANTANNSAAAATSVHGAFKPPAQFCAAVVVSPKSIFVGRTATLTLRVSQNGKPAAGISIRLKGSTLSLVTKKTNKQGVVKAKVNAKKAGIVSFSPVAHKKCTSPRIGVVGVFTPPVTG